MGASDLIKYIIIKRDSQSIMLLTLILGVFYVSSKIPLYGTKDVSSYVSLDLGAPTNNKLCVNRINKSYILFYTGIWNGAFYDELIHKFSSCGKFFHVSLDLGAITRYKHLIVITSRIELGAYIITGIINLYFWYLQINGMHIPTYVSLVWELLIEKTFFQAYVM